MAEAGNVIPLPRRLGGLRIVACAHIGHSFSRWHAIQDCDACQSRSGAAPASPTAAGRRGRAPAAEAAPPASAALTRGRAASVRLAEPVHRCFLERGDRVRVLSRSPLPDPEVITFQGDLATGRGIRESVTGVRTIIHAATLSPAARRGHFRPVDFITSPPDVDVDGTRRLVQEAKSAGVEHFMHISIVGVQQARVPYLRRKAQAENIVRSSAVPWTIAAATPFYWLLARLHDHMATKRLWLVASNLGTARHPSGLKPKEVGETNEPRPGRTGRSSLCNSPRWQAR